NGAPQGVVVGMLDEVRICNYAGSASEVASNGYGQIVSARGLLGRWPLDETGGLIAHDSSGHGVHGTLVNGPIWRSNDRPPADVFPRMKLDPINPDRTAALRRTEAQRAPPIFRFDPAVSDQVEKLFRTNFLLTREQFLAALEEALPRWQADPEA